MEGPETKRKFEMLIEGARCCARCPLGEGYESALLSVVASLRAELARKDARIAELEAQPQQTEFAVIREVSEFPVPPVAYFPECGQ